MLVAVALLVLACRGRAQPRRPRTRSCSPASSSWRSSPAAGCCATSAPTRPASPSRPPPTACALHRRRRRGAPSAQPLGVAEPHAGAAADDRRRRAPRRRARRAAPPPASASCASTSAPSSSASAACCPSAGPGLVALVPLVDRMVRVDLRTVTLTIPPQEVITRDNVPARVAAVCYFRIVDAAAAITQIEAFAPATSQIAQTTLRSVLGGADLDQLLAERERLNEAAAAHHRRADRALGRQGLHGRDQGRRDPGGDAARHGPPGRGRARAPREDHQRRGRVPGRRAARLGRRRSSAASRPRCSCATCRPCSR